MKKALMMIGLLCSFVGFSQEDAWVYFTAKNNSQTYFDSPLLMLSQRALDRRINQNITLDNIDIPIEPSYINQIKSVSGITVLAKSKWLNAIHVRGSQAIINSLGLISFVDRVDFANKALNQTGKKSLTAKTKMVNKQLETQIDYAYGASENQIKMLNGQVLHQQNYTGSGKIIAVMDAGFPGVNTALPFKKLRDNNQILGGYDFVSRNDNFYSGGSHGTLVLSAMGGYKENALVGTAPEASYYLFITEDDSSENPVEESLWVEAAERADSLGVDSINTSLGYFEFDNPAYNYTYEDMNGITTFISRGAEIAFSRGMIVVASAGNSGNSAEPHIAAPADAVSVIAVGALNSSKNLASFSSIGPSFDGRVKPEVMAQGQASVLSNPAGDIITANGTSFSGPIMAGMVNCLWQAFPSKTNKEIRQLLMESADRFTAPTVQFGYGIPNFNSALAKGLSLNENSKIDFVVYPNPTTDMISVTLSEEMEQGTVTVYSILGEKVLEQNITPQSSHFSMKGFASGTYIYKMESKDSIKTGKIIKE